MANMKYSFVNEDGTINESKLANWAIDASILEIMQLVLTLFSYINYIDGELKTKNKMVDGRESGIRVFKEKNTALAKERDALKNAVNVLMAESTDLKRKSISKKVEINDINSFKITIQKLQKELDYQTHMTQYERDEAKHWREKYFTLCDMIALEEGWDLYNK